MPRFSFFSLGKRGERRAARYLRSAGYRIRARSYCCPVGEIDLVAEKDDIIVFVEVKTRSADRFGEPWQAVNRAKRRKLASLAVYYLKHLRLDDRPYRFDIVSIVWPPGWFTRPTIEHFESAFVPE